jgi:Cft2 family RNA processing exonuclease
MSSLFEIKDKSLFIPSINLYIDSLKKKEFGFISHAHRDHIARHNQVICSENTAEFIKLRLANPDCLILPYSRAMKINRVKVTLLPAGHILGSSQLYIQTDSGSILYTGDFRTKKSRTVEKFVYQKCDVLIMESTFGMPQYLFPDREEIEKELLDLLKEKLTRGIIPVVFAYPLGKGQEALHLIGNSGLPVAVEHSILRYLKTYEKNNIQFGRYDKFKKNDFRSKVLLFPVHMRKNKFIQDLQNKYTIYLSGWGMDPSASYRFGVDRVLPLSDHADFNEMIEFVHKVEPKEIFCTHGSNRFVDYLKKEGFNAHPLIKPKQIDLFEI